MREQMQRTAVESLSTCQWTVLQYKGTIQTPPNLTNHVLLPYILK